MEFLYESGELDLHIMEFEHICESSIDIFTLDFEDAMQRVNPYVFVESSFDTLKDNITKAVNALIKMIKEFCHKIKLQFEIKAQQMELNKKLEEMKDLMAKKRSRITSKKVSYFDVKKYKEYYTDFINRYTAEIIKGMDKEFKTIKEYEKWRESMVNQLSDFNFKLSDEEQWQISTAINSAVELTEEQVKHRERNIDMVEKEGSKALKALESHYKKIDIESSYIKLKEPTEAKKIFSAKNSFLTFVCGKIAQAVKTIANLITKHAFLCVTALIVVLIAV